MRTYQRAAIGVAITAAAMLACPGAEAGKSGDVNKRPVMNAINPVLKRYGKMARIELEALCRPNEVGFPFIAVAPVPKRAAGTEAIRAIFASVPSTLVAEDHGVVHVRMGNAPDDLLKVHVSALHLSDEARWNAEVALYAILDSPEGQAAFKRLGLRMNGTVWNYILQPPRASVPHLPQDMRDTTIGKAFDDVARTFKGTVSFEVCPDHKRIDVDFDPVDEDLWP